MQKKRSSTRTPQARVEECSNTLLRSGYQRRTGGSQRQGAEAVDNGPAVPSAVVDIEVRWVLLDHVIVVIDIIVADVIDAGVINVRR